MERAPPAEEAKTAPRELATLVTPEAAVIERVMDGYAHPAEPGAAVAVVRGGALVVPRSFGLARLARKPPVPVGPDTSFRLASLTKQLTAKLVALLAEEGRLPLSTPVGEVLAGLPAWGGVVRVGHLVAHTSGLPEYESLIPDARTAPVSDREVVTLLASSPSLRFEPGRRFEYSNGGYALLAVLAEEVTGRGFGELLEERIFRPVGMTGSVAHVAGRTVVPRRAYGYRAADRPLGARAGVWEEADQSVTSAVLGDGGVYGSVLDLARWDAALYEPGYQPPPILLAPYAAPVRAGVAYGFGWYLDRFHGHVRQRHDGWTCGFQNEIQRFPEAGLAVVVLTNRSAPPVRGLAESIAARLLPGPASGGRW